MVIPAHATQTVAPINLVQTITRTVSLAQTKTVNLATHPTPASIPIQTAAPTTGLPIQIRPRRIEIPVATRVPTPGPTRAQTRAQIKIQIQVATQLTQA